MNKAVFLDKDGTINVDKGYVYKIEDFEFIPGVKEGLKILQNLGYKLIVITNQSGIGRGYYTDNDAKKMFNYMIEELLRENIKIDDILYCPHTDKDKCNCRKPKLQLFYKAKEKFDIDFSKSYAIGDKLRDLEICKKEKIKGFLLNDDVNYKKLENNIIVCKNLLESAKIIKEMDKI